MGPIDKTPPTLVQHNKLVRSDYEVEFERKLLKVIMKILFPLKSKL